ncbi:MAG TPA: T9SS type A sorting domain-containing protein, partial [Bacteroidales bacterium]|nr:T9SS type A sorting domain-containing protein [Bacteroidales bacterium]
IEAITSFSGDIPVNPSEIQSIQINQENTASRSWASATNTVEDVFKFAIAGTTGSASAPENPALVFLECIIHPDVPDEEVIPVNINQALVNEGNPRLLASNGSIKVNVPTVQKSEENNEFRIFPNPANEMLQFSGDLKISQVKIIDLSGRTLMMKEYQGTVTEDKIPIDNLRDGLYMVWFKTPSSVKLQKIVIRQ